MGNLMFTDVFDIFNDMLTSIAKPADSKNNTDTVEKITLNDIDFSGVSKEELDAVMNSLKKMKNNDVLSYILGDEYLDKLMGEIQAKWDIVHEKIEKPVEKPVTDKQDNNSNTSSVDSQIEKLVDEYMDELGVSDELKSNYLIQGARNSYINFAKFIYNHD